MVTHFQFTEITPSILNHRICRATTMTADTIYVDEDVGRDDDAAFGTATSPYKTLLHAMISHSPTTTFVTRKSQTGPVSPARVEAGLPIGTEESHKTI